MLAVSPTTTAYPAAAVLVVPAYSGNGRRPLSPYPDKPVDLKNLVMAAGRSAGRFVVWRHGSKKSPGNPTASMRSRFLALRVRSANRNIPRGADGSLPECWLLAEWPPGQPEPTDYWLSTLLADIRLRDVVRLAKIRWRIEHDYRELKDGLDHFEGCSWLGWHRHVTLTPEKPSKQTSSLKLKLRAGTKVDFDTVQTGHDDEGRSPASDIRAACIRARILCHEGEPTSRA